MARRNPVLPIQGGLNPSHIRLPHTAEPITADELLGHLIATQRRRHPDDNDAARQARFDAGEVRLTDGTILRPDSMIRPGQEMWFYRMPAQETRVPGHPRIIYSADGIVVIDKPAFLATMPRGRHITETALVRLRRATGNNELSPAHRLDRMTSGLLLFTTRREVRGAYQQLFATGAVHKTYEAIAPYDPQLHRRLTQAQDDGDSGLLIRQRMYKDHGWLQTILQEGEPNAVTLIRDIEPLTTAAEATLRARFLAADTPATANSSGVADIPDEAASDDPFPPVPTVPLARYELQPLTGKTHQLRLCLCSLGVPIINDPVYPTVLPEAAGNRPDVLARPLQLRAVAMHFTDPLSDRPVTLRTHGLVPH